MIGFQLRKLKKRLVGAYYRIKTGMKYIPTFAVIELTSRCNAKCSFCPREFKEEIGDMDIEIFKQIVDSMPYVAEVMPQGVGEPTIYGHLPEAIKYLKKKGKRSVFYTNGYALTKNLMIRLLDAGLDEIRFSIDAKDTEMYEEMRGLDFNKVLHNIKAFQSLTKLPQYSTKTVVRMVKNESNEHMIDEIVNFWKNIVDEVGVQNEIDILLPTEWLYLNNNGQRVACPRIHNEIIINHKGEIILCCEDWFNQYVVGHVDDGVLEVFNGEKLNQVRRHMDMGLEIPALCKKCSKLRKLK